MFSISLKNKKNISTKQYDVQQSFLNKSFSEKELLITLFQNSFILLGKQKFINKIFNSCPLCIQALFAIYCNINLAITKFSL